MRLEVFLYNLIDLTLARLRLDWLETPTHWYQVSFELRHNILSETPRAVTHSLAEVAYPRPRILTHLEIIFVASWQASVAEFAVAPVDWLLRECQMSLYVDVTLVAEVELQNFGREDVDCLLEEGGFCGSLWHFRIVDDVTFNEVSHRWDVLDVDWSETSLKG